MILQRLARPAAPLVLLALALQAARADVGKLHVSSDYDAEFARAADLLEAGRRPEAEQILEEVRRRAGERAWQARVDLLLALDDERRGDFAAAARRLGGTPAASIGLESYRRDRLARDLAAAGRAEEAIREFHALLADQEPYAWRPETALSFARLLERRKSLSAAAAVLARAAEASPSGRGILAIDRLRLALERRDAATARAVAREVLLESPLADRSKTLPAKLKRALAREEAALSLPDRARRGRALIAAGDAKRGVRLLARGPVGRWPSQERGANLLALARGQARLGRIAVALRAAAAVREDGSAVSYEARLLRADLLFARLKRKIPGPLSRMDARRAGLVRTFRALTAPESPISVRARARRRLIRLDADAGDFEGGLAQARLLVKEQPGSRTGFEPLWRLAWEAYRSGDRAAALARFEELETVATDLGSRRRLSYWKARCLEREGQKTQAESLFRALASADPPDIYARFARERVPASPGPRPAPLPDPSTATATFRRVDELLRLRMFEEASAEARQLASSRGRDLRLAESEFALGRFAAAVAAAKRAFPEMGTAEEGRVPDGWRRLYYPIEDGGFLAERAREFQLDPSLLRGLVRQESVFAVDARSRAGALGLTQLLPSTARSVARSVLRVRYRRAFLYDPAFNARIGAAYLRRLDDRFGGNPIFALAAYNGGPGRMARVLRENPGLSEDELFESFPASESRDYVRRVVLFAESYRELYPE